MLKKIVRLFTRPALDSELIAMLRMKNEDEINPNNYPVNSGFWNSLGLCMNCHIDNLATVYYSLQEHMMHNGQYMLGGLSNGYVTILDHNGVPIDGLESLQDASLYAILADGLVSKENEK